MCDLDIDRLFFVETFGRDADYPGDYPLLHYLDRKTGEVIWIFENDDDALDIAGIPIEENRSDRERAAADPERFLEIPGLDHGEHHRIIRQFLGSDWTDDDALWRRANEAYTGSIGRWKRRIADKDVVHAFYDFQDARIAELAEEFLRETGITPNWTRSRTQRVPVAGGTGPGFGR
ncbi:MAG: hypothetical protein OXI81_19910 [Paracoccaceae bacterium]|nr:hypothetical protein [Paracoccaceae bacterium]